MKKTLLFLLLFFSLAMASRIDLGNNTFTVGNGTADLVQLQILNDIENNTFKDCGLLTCEVKLKLTILNDFNLDSGDVRGRILKSLRLNNAFLDKTYFLVNESYFVDEPVYEYVNVSEVTQVMNNETGKFENVTINSTFLNLTGYERKTRYRFVESSLNARTTFLKGNETYLIFKFKRKNAVRAASDLSFDFLGERFDEYAWWNASATYRVVFNLYTYNLTGSITDALLKFHLNESHVNFANYFNHTQAVQVTFTNATEDEEEVYGYKVAYFNESSSNATIYIRIKNNQIDNLSLSNVTFYFNPDWLASNESVSRTFEDWSWFQVFNNDSSSFSYSSTFDLSYNNILSQVNMPASATGYAPSGRALSSFYQSGINGYVTSNNTLLDNQSGFVIMSRFNSNSLLAQGDAYINRIWATTNVVASISGISNGTHFGCHYYSLGADRNLGLTTDFNNSNWHDLACFYNGSSGSAMKQFTGAALNNTRYGAIYAVSSFAWSLGRAWTSYGDGFPGDVEEAALMNLYPSYMNDDYLILYQLTGKYVSFIQEAQFLDVYWVNLTGDDGNIGTSDQPFRTIAHAVDVITSNGLDNRAIMIDDGTFYEELDDTTNSLYVGADNVTVRAVNQLNATVIANDSACTNLFEIAGNNVTITGLNLNGTGPSDACERGIVLRKEYENAIVTHNEIFDFDSVTASAGIYLQANGTQGHNNATIFNNTLYSVDDDVIWLDYGTANNTNVTGNSISIDIDTNTKGVSVDEGATVPGYNLTIYGNTFAVTTSIGHLVYLDPSIGFGPQNTEILSNEFGQQTNPAQGYIYATNVSNVLIENNTFYVNQTSAISVHDNTTLFTINKNTFGDATFRCDTNFNSLIFVENANETNVTNNDIHIQNYSEVISLEATDYAIENVNVLFNDVMSYSYSFSQWQIVNVGNTMSGPFTDNVNISHNNFDHYAFDYVPTFGIYSNRVTNMHVSSNLFNRWYYAMANYVGENVSFINNTITDFTYRGFLDSESNFTLIENNTFTSNVTFTEYISVDGGGSSVINTTIFNNTFWGEEQDLTMGGDFITSNFNVYNLTSNNNTFYMPAEGYPDAFYTWATGFENYIAWQYETGQDNESEFYPQNAVNLISPSNNTWFNGYNWTAALWTYGVDFTNATLVLNYTNGTNYATIVNQTDLTNASLNTLFGRINVTMNFTWDVCFLNEFATWPVTYFETCEDGEFNVFGDQVAPFNITVNSPVNYSNYSFGGAILNVSAEDNESGISYCGYTINGSGGFTWDCTTMEFNILNGEFGEGQNNVNVSAYDEVDNSISAMLWLFVDRIAPNINVTYPINGTGLTGLNQYFETNITDYGLGVDECWYDINGSANTTFNCTSFNAVLGAGDNWINVYANDTMGNENSYMYYAPVVIGFYVSCNYQYIEIGENTSIASEIQANTFDLIDLDISGEHKVLLFLSLTTAGLFLVLYGIQDMSKAIFKPKKPELV